MRYIFTKVMIAAVASLTFGRPLAAAPAPLTLAIAAPTDPFAYRSLTLDAKAAFERQDYPRAEELFRAAARTYPLDHNNWRYLAASLRLQGKWAEAIPAYQQLIDRAGTFMGSGRYWQAVAQIKLGRTDAALNTIQTMVEIDHDGRRPSLGSDEQFKQLWDNPRFIAIVAPRSTAGPQDRVSGWRSDLGHLISEIHRLTPDYRGRALPSTTQMLVEQLRRAIPRLTDEQILLGMSDILGSLHQGHTMMWGFSFEPGAKQRLAFEFLPVQPYAFPDGLFIVDADPANRSLVGAKITAIGDIPVDQVMARVRQASSFGSEAEFAWTGPLRAMSVPLLVGIGAAKRDRPVSLTVEKNGRSSVVSLQPAPAMLGQKLPRRTPNSISPSPKTPFDFAPTSDGSTIMVRFDQVQDAEAESLSAFAKRLDAALSSANIRNVIVDLRLNNGGNTFLYTDLLRSLTAFSTREDRQVYALIGRNVYSAAGNFATDLERLANPIFIGEPTGNTGNQFGDEGIVVLPWSGLHATIASVKWQLSNPWDTRGSIVPHVPVQSLASDYFAGRDLAFETALKLARKRS